jgi:hypothetical protein
MVPIRKTEDIARLAVKQADPPGRLKRHGENFEREADDITLVMITGDFLTDFG